MRPGAGSRLCRSPACICSHRGRACRRRLRRKLVGGGSISAGWCSTGDTKDCRPGLGCIETARPIPTGNEQNKQRSKVENRDDQCDAYRANRPVLGTRRGQGRRVAPRSSARSTISRASEYGGFVQMENGLRTSAGAVRKSWPVERSLPTHLKPAARAVHGIVPVPSHGSQIGSENCSTANRRSLHQGR